MDEEVKKPKILIEFTAPDSATFNITVDHLTMGQVAAAHRYLEVLANVMAGGLVAQAVTPKIARPPAGAIKVG